MNGRDTKQTELEIKDKINLNLQKLTPTDTCKMHYYDEAFDFIFNNKDVLNVAISGPYSAGKSSVIETYKKNNSEIGFRDLASDSR